MSRTLPARFRNRVACLITRRSLRRESTGLPVQTALIFVLLVNDKLQKPLRKIRKLLKNVSNPPAPEEVHDLRTASRKLEATFQAFSLVKPPKRAENILPINPITITCPFCGAKPHRDCATSAGGLSAIHVQRINAAAFKEAARDTR